MASLRQTSLLFAGLWALASAQRNLRKLGPGGGKIVAFKDAKSGGGMVPPGTNSSATDGGRIIGGADVAPGTLPFYGNFEGSVMCGGALIHEDIFLTAAHCLEAGYPKTIKIGATTTVSANEGQSVSVCTGIIHPNNNMKAMENDVAILKLCDPISVTAYAKFNTDSSYPSATGTDLYMIGFGRTQMDGGLSPILQAAQVDYLNDDVCKARYSKYDGKQTMCADSPTNGMCYGDSGGPFLDKDNLVVGLSSFIIDTCSSEFPDFFTRISTYSGWIKNITCQEALRKPSWCSGSPSEGGTPSQGDNGDDENGGNDDENGGNDDENGGNDDGNNGGEGEDSPVALFTQLITLIIGFLQSLLGGR